MKKPASLVALSLMLFSSRSAFAETPPPAVPNARPGLEMPSLPPDMPQAPLETGVPTPDVAAVAPAAVPPPPPSAVPASENAAAGPSSSEDRRAETEVKIDGISETLDATRGAVDRLSKIKVSGYIQGRYEWHGDSANGLNSAGKPADTNRFFVRRGRLKTSYDGTNAEFMLQIDATGDGVVLKDAEATFVDTWSPLNLRFTVGQFKWPFGYEILQSSGDREMPERSLVIRKQFPGERDRGLRLQGKYDQLRFSAALVNGNGTQDAIYGATDQTGFKDLVGRVGGDFDWLVVGLSGYFGRTQQTTVASAATLTWVDKNMDKMITVDELVSTAAKPASYRRFSVVRFGADAQAYFDVPVIGGLALKAELVFSKLGNLDPGAINANTMLPTPQACYDFTSLGWIVTAVQNIGEHVGAVLRVDSYDPNISKALDSTCPATFITAGQGDRVTTVGGGLLVYGSANIKGTMIYEHLAEQSKTASNDIFTAQLQARF